MNEAEIVTRLRAAGCVFAEDEAALLLGSGGDLDAVAALVARRVAGEPLEQVLGWAGFRGRRLHVVPGVFVPRRRSELLAGEAISLLSPGSVAVELCCGVAPVAAAIRAEVPGVEVYAADVSPLAVACARTNLPPGDVFEGDLFSALPEWLRERVDVLVANTPYVPSDEVAFLPPEAREHEPLETLDGGPDGLTLLRRISASASEWLAPGGHLLIEVSERQLPAAMGVFAADGLSAASARDDDLGAVVVIGSPSGTGG